MLRIASNVFAISPTSFESATESLYQPCDNEGKELVASLKVQVPNNHIVTQSLYYNYYEPELKYLIIGYLEAKSKWRIRQSFHLWAQGLGFTWAIV